MGLLNLFKLEKLRIEAFTKVDRKSAASPDGIDAMFNPTSYKRSHAIAYRPARRAALNSPGQEASYSFTPPAELSFTLIFDGTGVDDFGVVSIARQLMGQSVKKTIDKLEKVCLNFNGDIHEPNFLTVRWGDFKFDCRLKSLEIAYKLFDESGDPLRAEVSIAFIEDKSFETWARQAGRNSPDLTHVRVVKVGDTLPLLCQEIYGSPVHYLQVARDNGLDNFRDLVPGQRLVFAPLARATTSAAARATARATDRAVPRA
jgi:hypothetical protein